ncbi:hypothetical protein BLNAU_10315 [Blattamonas nauphoetae]|uniref:Uncharacterized protein n=1 Tax=Blattamonas nauphoetae TaxID=2049346 RepID=A0ABQ9XT54_9EUKA|nr:hypothetical protein BLNAU_10315 [Blattamonas nauphoetae]
MSEEQIDSIIQTLSLLSLEELSESQIGNHIQTVLHTLQKTNLSENQKQLLSTQLTSLIEALVPKTAGPLLKTMAVLNKTFPSPSKDSSLLFHVLNDCIEFGNQQVHHAVLHLVWAISNAFFPLPRFLVFQSGIVNKLLNILNPCPPTPENMNVHYDFLRIFSRILRLGTGAVLTTIPITADDKRSFLRQEIFEKLLLPSQSYLTSVFKPGVSDDQQFLQALGWISAQILWMLPFIPEMQEFADTVGVARMGVAGMAEELDKDAVEFINDIQKGMKQARRIDDTRPQQLSVQRDVVEEGIEDMAEARRLTNKDGLEGQAVREKASFLQTHVGTNSLFRWE